MFEQSANRMWDTMGLVDREESVEKFNASFNYIIGDNSVRRTSGETTVNIYMIAP